MTHSFEVDIAVEYGIEAAIILHDLCYWLIKNRANDINYKDGRYWDYNSKSALKELYPYMSEYAIDSTLKRLKERGIILTGCFNKLPFDRTTWYTLTDEGWALFKGRENDVVKSRNPLLENKAMQDPQIIPTIPTHIIPTQEDNKIIKDNDVVIKSKDDIDISKDIDSTKDSKEKTKKFIPPTVDEVAAYCRERKNDINAESFVDFYESKGWLIGKNKMKDWRAAVRTWERNNHSNKGKGKIYDSVDDDDIVIVRAW